VWRTRKVIAEESIAESAYEKELTSKELKSNCFLFAREHFQGKYFMNNDTGRDILVSRDGLDKWNFITKSREQSLSIKKLDTILQNCKKVDENIDKKNRHSVDGFTYFQYKITINDKPYNINLATRETNKTGSKYYYHYLEDIKIEPDTGASLV
jgi:hypothetical protein